MTDTDPIARFAVDEQVQVRGTGTRGKVEKILPATPVEPLGYLVRNNLTLKRRAYREEQLDPAEVPTP